MFIYFKFKKSLEVFEFRDSYLHLCAHEREWLKGFEFLLRFHQVFCA